ncbi:MAG: branched-chain amino acid aminotransferase [Saprospiraceae bacterium]|nr:branched-chain amino acid aminotransferase [Saprospiraceae bacterium]
MIRYHSVNGKLLSAKEAKVAINDLGLLRGYGIFDFFPIRNGYPLFADDYFNRFYTSAAKMHIQVPKDRSDLIQDVVDLAAHNKVERAYTKLVLTGGPAADGYTPSESSIMIIQHEDVAYDPVDYQDGIRLLLHRYARDRPEIKTLNYANVIRHREMLNNHRALDLLYHDGRNVHETSRANFFIFDEHGNLYTSGSSALSGITRMHVIKTAHRHGLTVKEGPLPLHALLRASEAFITSTTKGVLPVTRINDLVIGDGVTGPRTLRLHHQFEAYMQEAEHLQL